MFDDDDLSLRGQLLIAMPTIGDPRFERTVIYMCAHSTEKGAMGLVVNKPVDGLHFLELFGQLEIKDVAIDDLPVHFGGPVEASRGFVLHSTDYKSTGASTVTDDIAMTATLDILRDIASGAGPERRILALGYSGWAPGQIEDEIKANGWLVVEADDALVFGDDLDAKWAQALAKIGVDASFLSGEAGHA
jgi:putative transcriptional regulator